MGKKPVLRGPVADRVSANVHRFRERQRMSLADLAERLGQIGRPMAVSAVHKIEKGERRVDVDDLVALAIALRVAPNDLLLIGMWESNAEVPLTSKVVADNARAAWEWAMTAAAAMQVVDDPLTLKENGDA